MPKYLDSDGVAYLWSKITHKTQDVLTYYSKTTEEWNQNISQIAEKGTLYIYTDYKVIQQDDDNIIYLPGLKIGDGTSYLIDLPFINKDLDSRLGELEQLVLDHINNNIIHISSSERDFWNNKLNYQVQPQLNNDTLVFNRR